MGDTRRGGGRRPTPPGEIRDDPTRCPVGHALDVVSGRWATLIVHNLSAGSLRFGELRAALGGLNPKTLTDQLRALEAEGILTRTAYAEIPPRVEYALTERGRGLTPVIAALAAWGAADLVASTPAAEAAVVPR